jgi:ketosteroid isomerase-like protein
MLTMGAAAVVLAGALAAAEPDAGVARQLVALERQAMDGWSKGSPDADLAISDPAITYIDPARDGRIEGRAALAEFFEKYRGTPLFDSYEIVDPKVRVAGDTAVLSFFLQCRRSETDYRYNATLVWQRTGDGWRVIHEHWSKVRNP